MTRSGEIYDHTKSVQLHQRGRNQIKPESMNYDDDKGNGVAILNSENYFSKLDKIVNEK